MAHEESSPHKHRLHVQLWSTMQHASHTHTQGMFMLTNVDEETFTFTCTLRT
eukprot:m.214737 g.214737  ORF g.214737 m.214737 type:complete len:52 (-) comp27325_c0_seq1:19-174(-)